MNDKAKRNHFRGLKAFVAENYNILAHEASVDHLGEWLATKPSWSEVPRASVITCFRSLRREQEGQVAGKRRPPPPDILITLPLPRRQTATLKYSEAREVWHLLSQIFRA